MYTTFNHKEYNSHHILHHANQMALSHVYMSYIGGKDFHCNYVNMYNIMMYVTLCVHIVVILGDKIISGI